MNRKDRRTAGRASLTGASRPQAADDDAHAVRLFKAIEHAVPAWCAAAKTLGELKNYCATITPHGDTYLSTRAEAIESLTKLGRADVVAAIRRASSKPDELLIVGVKDYAFMSLYGRDVDAGALS